MPSQLSKLHVRFIQTQKSFFLQRSKESQAEKLALENLYIKNNNSFYFANQSNDIEDGTVILLSFKEANDYLTSLLCDVKVEVIDQQSDEYEDALLFFHQDAAVIKQLLLLQIEATQQS